MGILQTIVPLIHSTFKALKHSMQLGGYFLKGVFDTSISFKDAELVYSKSFEINQQQTYRESSVYAGWMNRVPVKEDSFSP